MTFECWQAFVEEDPYDRFFVVILKGKDVNSRALIDSFELQDLSSEGSRYEGRNLNELLVELLTQAKHEADRRNAELERYELGAAVSHRRDE